MSLEDDLQNKEEAKETRYVVMEEGAQRDNTTMNNDDQEGDKEEVTEQQQTKPSLVFVVANELYKHRLPLALLFYRLQVLINFGIHAYFWMCVAAARGHSRNLECDLNVELRRYFRYSTFEISFAFLGVIHIAVIDSYELLRLHNETKHVSSIILALFLKLLSIFFGCQAVMWVPDGATCPETAPELFLASKTYFLVYMILLTISLFLLPVFGCCFKNQTPRDMASLYGHMV